jgi:nitrogen fixation/metabolism regulation signal transduction histidine kinase
VSHEEWLKIGLTLTVTLILSLTGALTWSLGWSGLATSTLLFFIAYPLIWLAWRCYIFWRQSITQHTIYAQVLREGQHNLRFKKQHPDNLLLDLQQEISSLAKANDLNNMQNQTIDNMLSQILDSWSVPVCLFDHDLNLTYRNNAMNQAIQQPMLLGSDATELGFLVHEGLLSHPEFDQQWQTQTISYLYEYQKQTEKHWLFSAVDIRQNLSKNQSITEQNVIRVLAHEIRNSLTPMYSMTDTLLNQEQFDQQQVRLVLTRINQRSNRLLSFIGKYSKLSHLPPPVNKWFEFQEILAEANNMLEGTVCHIEFQGNQQCYGDSEQIVQVMINILKNAQEACKTNTAIVHINAYYQQDSQVIEMTDNGPGFGNLDNVMTPFYTTKKEGSGVGLPLCAEIVRNHGGQFKVANKQQGGAMITMSWPLHGVNQH